MRSTYIKRTKQSNIVRCTVFCFVLFLFFVVVAFVVVVVVVVVLLLLFSQQNSKHASQHQYAHYWKHSLKIGLHSPESP